MAQSPTRTTAREYFDKAFEASDEPNLPEAIRLIEKAIELCATDSIYWSAKGLFLGDADRFEEAISAAQRAVEIDPENHHGWRILGLNHGYVGLFEEAASYFLRSIELYEDYNTYVMLAAAEIRFDSGSILAWYSPLIHPKVAPLSNSQIQFGNVHRTWFGCSAISASSSSCLFSSFMFWLVFRLWLEHPWM